MKKLLLTFLLAVGFLGLFPIIGFAAAYDTALSKYDTANVALQAANSQLAKDQAALIAVKAANPIVVPVRDQAAVDVAFTALQTAQATVAKDKIAVDTTTSAQATYVADQGTYTKATDFLATARENLMEASRLNDATYAARSNSYNPFTVDALAKAQTAYDAALVAYQAADATAAKDAIAADAATAATATYAADQVASSNAMDYYLTTVKNVDETYSDTKNSAANIASMDAIGKAQAVVDADYVNTDRVYEDYKAAAADVKSTAEAARAAIDSSGTNTATNLAPSAPAVAAPVTRTNNVPNDGLVRCGRGNDAQTDATSCNLIALFDMINAIINWLIMISMPLAAIAFAYAGWLYLSAGDDTGQVTKAKAVFLNVGIGVIVILAGWLVFKLIETTFLNTANYATYLTK